MSLCVMLPPPACPHTQDPRHPSWFLECLLPASVGQGPRPHLPSLEDRPSRGP